MPKYRVLSFSVAKYVYEHHRLDEYGTSSDLLAFRRLSSAKLLKMIPSVRHFGLSPGEHDFYPLRIANPISERYHMEASESLELAVTASSNGDNVCSSVTFPQSHTHYSYLKIHRVSTSCSVTSGTVNRTCSTVRVLGCSSWPCSLPDRKILDSHKQHVKPQICTNQGLDLRDLPSLGNPPFP